MRERYITAPLYMPRNRSLRKQETEAQPYSCLGGNISEKPTHHVDVISSSHQVRKEWKVKGAVFGTIDGRVTYVLDKNGVVTSMYDNLLDGAAHSKEALKALAA